MRPAVALLRSAAREQQPCCSSRCWRAGRRNNTAAAFCSGHSTRSAIVAAPAAAAVPDAAAVVPDEWPALLSAPPQRLRQPGRRQQQQQPPRGSLSQQAGSRMSGPGLLAAATGLQQGESASMLARSIMRDISQADSLAVLEDVVNEWGSSFDFIHVSAALVKLAKLRGDRSATAQMLQRLNSLWRRKLAEAGSREAANVLWAWGRLGATDLQLWDETLAAFVASNVGAAPGQAAGIAQKCANVLWACAKLRRPPAAEQLQALLQAFVQPAVLDAAKPQAVANTAWALSELRSARGYQGVISAELVQQLLGQEQLQLVALQGVPVDTSNVLLALGRLASGDAPVLTRPLAQQRAQQLLDGAKQRGLSKWSTQATANALWSCGELQLADEKFLEAAIACLVQQLPSATVPDLVQLAGALTKLQRQDAAALIALVLKRGQQLLKAAHSSVPRQRPLSLRDTANLAAMVPEAVAALDMQELAGDVVALVASSRISQEQNIHFGNLRRLWQVHCWLRQHGLLDGRGLAGLLTEPQLQQGEQEAATWSGGRL